MSTDSILSNLLQEEKHRLETNSNQKSKLLAAISYIEKLEAEIRRLTTAKPGAGIKIEDIDVRDLARLGFEAHWNEYPEAQRRPWDPDGFDLIPWLSAAIVIRSHCFRGFAAIRRLENMAACDEVDIKIVTTTHDNQEPGAGFRVSLNGVYGIVSRNMLEAIESALTVGSEDHAL
jgi:hypothetical protein